MECPDWGRAYPTSAGSPGVKCKYKRSIFYGDKCAALTSLLTLSSKLPIKQRTENTGKNRDTLAARAGTDQFIHQIKLLVVR